MTTAQVGQSPPNRNKLLVRGIQDSLVRCGLARTEYTIAGETVHIPRIVSADAGPIAWVQIDLLPGQSVEDFAAHASEIAQHLDVTNVGVIPLGRSRIRLEFPAPRVG